jgi:protein SCO1/2
MGIMTLLRLLATLAAAAAIVAGAFFTLATLRPDASTLQFESTDISDVAWGRDFQLTGHDGRELTLGDFHGKVVALYFGYTRCPDVCPTTMAALAQAIELLGDQGPRVQGLFVTVDPRHDSPEVLARYVRLFHADFVGLYGDRKAIARTAREFKVQAGEHHSIPVFLFDANGRLRVMVHPEATAESIAHDLRMLAKAG